MAVMKLWGRQVISATCSFCGAEMLVVLAEQESGWWSTERIKGSCIHARGDEVWVTKTNEIPNPATHYPV